MYITELGFAIRVYGEPSEFASKIVAVLRKLVDEKYPGKEADGVRWTFSHGVSRFLEKEIRFAPKDKNQIKKIIENLNKMINHFNEIIEKSINQFKDKSST